MEKPLLILLFPILIYSQTPSSNNSQNLTDAGHWWISACGTFALSETYFYFIEKKVQV